jgi:LPS-assembly protein
MLYYEDARLEFFGLPVAYVPFASAPDPSVSRKTGLLTPRYMRRATTGYGVQIPYYFALAPHYDVLWTVTPMSRQGVLNEVEWRHRLETGVYNIRAAGIWQADPKAFLAGPFGPNKPQFGPRSFQPNSISLTEYPAELRRFRGSLETTGKFLINDKWSFGWDVALQTDRYFFGNYRVKSESLTGNYFRESISNVYLRGKSDRAYFDLQGFYIQTVSAFDLQKQLPIVHPVLDYNRRFQLEGPIGGELSLDINVTSLSRDAADYVGLPSLAQRFAVNNKTPWGIGNTRFITNGQSLFVYGLGSQIAAVGLGCDPTIGGYSQPNCLLRGIAGTTSRASAVISWRRSFIDPIGQVWTPFVSAQVDARTHSLNLNGGYTGDPYRLLGNAVYGNDKQTNFIATDDTSFRAMPAIGVDYRYPLIATSSFGSHLIEPIAQIIARPNEQRIGRSPNEDAQSLIFSDSNLFTMNKFSGYDRVEGGVRANVGAQYTLNLNNGGYANALFGQSYHLAGRNSFAVRDQINTGLDSGLDKARSDYVGRFTFAPVAGTSFSARGRFDEASLKLKRLEVSGSFVSGPLSGSIIYARQDAQPELGYVRRREGISLSGRVGLPNNWFVSGGVLIDLDRYLLDRDLTINNNITYAQQVALGITPTVARIDKFNSSPLRPASFNVGFGYIDECTTFTVNYIRSTSDYVGTAKSTNSTVLFRLELKHLGQAGYRQTLSGSVPSETLR